ncbi:hypothetical protein BKA70DRAFT_1428453 [Coprinopsis sp. MPI-PUGE-AT-0042]|nr:hypothetical protein BKA70DRAFT_1428453 [Coprinopsis sp. MPI-PUGE-AT-0042]
MADKENTQPINTSRPTGPLDYAATHSLRNPFRPVIPACSNPGSKKTAAQKATAAAGRELRTSRAAAFAEDVAALALSQEEAIAELALRHNKKVVYTTKIVQQQSSYKPSRRPSLHNAKIHYKAMELNNGHPEGDKATLNDILEAIEDDEELRNLTKDDSDALLKELVAWRELNKGGVRLNNKASTQDASCTFDRAGRELDNLHARTGAPSFAFMTRGHTNDTVVPAWTAAGDAEDFLHMVFNKTTDQLSVEFELWSVGRAGQWKKLSVAEKQKKCAEMIIQGLRTVTGERDLDMSYKSYKVQLQVKYKILLDGWPIGIKFEKPSSIGGGMTNEEYRSVLKKVKVAPVVSKTARSRSDKGIPRGPNKRTRKESPPRAGKKAKSNGGRAKRMLPPGVAARSREEQSSEDEEEEEELTESD